MIIHNKPKTVLRHPEFENLRIFIQKWDWLRNSRRLPKIVTPFILYTFILVISYKNI